ncbi:MAG: hypothetical protein ACOYWZ_13155 [Bacillota bacterium]
MVWDFYDLKSNLIFIGVMGILALVAYICDRNGCDKKCADWLKRMLKGR